MQSCTCAETATNTGSIFQDRRLKQETVDVALFQVGLSGWPRNFLNCARLSAEFKKLSGAIFQDGRHKQEVTQIVRFSQCTRECLIVSD